MIMIYEEQFEEGQFAQLGRPNRKSPHTDLYEFWYILSAVPGPKFGQGDRLTGKYIRIR